MRPLISHIPLTACALATALLVSACGGGDASAPPTVIGTSGLAVDDYISGATVVCDTNGNGVSDTGEATATTDSTGFFKFATVCASGLVSTGGTNIDTKLPFVGKLKAPAGSTLVTPLTTLIAEGMTQDQINTALGLPTDTNVTTLDPARKVAGELVNADLFRKTLVVQQVLQKTAEALAALQGSNDVAAMYSQAAAAMTSVLRTPASASLVAGGVVNEAAVLAVVKAAATRVAAGVNADSLAQVMAGALAAQSKAILDATNAESISTATKAQQGSSTINSFVVANKAALAGEPGDAMAALKTQLMEQVGGGSVTPPPPPPPASGTVLLSFDEPNPVFIEMGAYGGALPEVVAGPAGGSGSALKIVKPAGQEPWGGTYFGVPAVPFAADRKIITARVYSTRANAVIKFKVEHNNQVATEVASAPVAANTWTTVSWDMTGIDLSKSYAVIAITPDQDVTASGQTYYIDDITLAAAATSQPPAPAPAPAANCSTSTEQCVSFSEANIGVNAFEGLVSAEVITDPSAATNKVVKMVKGPSSQPWAGATVFTAIATDGDKTIRTVPTVGLGTNKSVTLRAYSGAPVGTKVSLKLENALGAGSVFAEARTTKLNEWETLTFNFASPSAGTFNANVSYDMASLFPAWSEIQNTQTALGADTTFYFDELKYAMSAATPPAPPPPAAGSVLASFDEATPPALNEFGGAVAVIAAGPAGGSGKALKITRNGGDPWAGSWIGIPQIPSNAGTQVVSAKFYSPTAGIPVFAKIEFDDNQGSGDVKANETVVAGWQTLTFTYSNLNATKVYNRFVMLPNLGAQDTAKDYFFDDITVAASGGSSGGGTTPPVGGDPTAEMGSGGPQALPLAVSNDQHAFIFTGDGVFAGDYIGKLDANGNHAGWDNASTNGIAKNGNIGYFQDALLSGASSQIVETGGNGWVTGNIDNPGGVGGFFRYFILRAPAATFANSYMGLYANAPNNGTVDVSTYGNIKFKLWGPAEMYQLSFSPTVQVILTGPKVAGCTATGSGGTEIIKNLVANQKIGAGSSYTMSLAGWTVNGVCGTDTNATAVNTVLSKLARVVVNVPGTSFNFTHAAPGDSTIFATGVNLGPIAFTK